MPVTHYLPGRTIRIDGRERLYFSGTSYLGMGHNRAFRELLYEGIERYGTIYSSSRSSNVRLAIYEEGEQLLANVTGAEAALTFSSGFQAGQAAIQALATQPTFVYAPNTHPAVWRSASDASYGDFTAWAASVAHRASATAEEIVVVANSLDPLLAQEYSFAWVAELPEDRAITLLVDDSHGLGVIGEEGRGIWATLQALAKPNVVVVVISSLGKAFGVPGGVVLGTRHFIDTLKQTPFFTAGSPFPPAYLYAFVHAQPLYQQARQQLIENVAHFRAQTDRLAIFQYIDQYPVFYTSDDALVAAVAPQCVLSSFPYPHPHSARITRAVVSSLHTPADLDTLGGLVKKYVTQKNDL